MASNTTLIDGIQPGVITVVDAYTSPTNGGGTRIIAFTASNTSGATTETYTVFVVPSGGSPNATNEIVPPSIVAVDDRETPSELISHLIPPGGTLRVQVSTASTISFRATGIEF